MCNIHPLASLIFQCSVALNLVELLQALFLGSCPRGAGYAMLMGLFINQYSLLEMRLIGKLTLVILRRLGEMAGWESKVRIFRPPRDDVVTWRCSDGGGWELEVLRGGVG